jgi:hypothetical protein
VPKLQEYNNEKLLDYFTGKQLRKRIGTFYGQNFLGVDCVTDVGGRAPTSNRANPYWPDFGCGYWNRDIVLKSGDSERPTRSEASAKESCIANM